MSTTPDKSNLTQPYPGMRPFLRDEAKLFFGRADQINRMLARLEENRFLAVVGGSGSGKSSLVRAGLLPVLGQGYLLGAGTDWRFVVMRPGGDPFGNLAAEFHRAVADDTDGHDPGDIAFTQATLQTSPRGFLEVVEESGLDEGVPLLLLVDQFEEIFRFRRRHAAGGPAGEGERAIHEERNDATALVNLLLTTAQAAAQAELPIYVVITMRSDFIGDCDVFPDLPQAISDSQFLVPRLTRRQMQEVIEKPLLLFGGKAAPDLVNQILNDVGTDPDQLPLMQHALMRTWFAARARWRGGNEEKVLALGDYSSVGRFSYALSRHLEEAWLSLADVGERRIARQLFLCLSERAGEGALIRRMVKLGEVAAVAKAETGEVIKVVRVFQEEGRNFIMASPPGELRAESVLDISHEALLRQWARLRSWRVEE
jgi:energy-coupling factor transporter ATP-binding protein EcfA2